MAFSYHVFKFESIILVNGTQWSQSISENGVMYKSLGDPYSKIIVQASGSKKLFQVPKDRTVIVKDDTVHFLGELV